MGLLDTGPSFRNVFFSFHYGGGVMCASQIRQAGAFLGREQVGFSDWADWQEVRVKDQASIHRWIDKQLAGATVTAVLIGQDTWQRPFVEYGIRQSVQRGMGLLGRQFADAHARRQSVLTHPTETYRYSTEQRWRTVRDRLHTAHRRRTARDHLHTAFARRTGAHVLLGR